MLATPIFPYNCNFVADDASNLLDDHVDALNAIVDYYQTEITTNSVALIETNRDEYLFLVDVQVHSYDIVKVTVGFDKSIIQVLATFNKISTDTADAE